MVLQHEGLFITVKADQTIEIEDISLLTLESIFQAAKEHSEDRIPRIRSSICSSHRKYDFILYEHYLLHLNGGFKEKNPLHGHGFSCTNGVIKYTLCNYRPGLAKSIFWYTWGSKHLKNVENN